MRLFLKDIFFHEKVVALVLSIFLEVESFLGSIFFEFFHHCKVFQIFKVRNPDRREIPKNVTIRKNGFLASKFGPFYSVAACAKPLQ